jgi:hypothetical protein
LACSAIAVMTLRTSPISFEEAPSWPTVAVASAALFTAVSATRAASAELWAISRIEADICSLPAATVCGEVSGDDRVDRGRHLT